MENKKGLTQWPPLEPYPNSNQLNHVCGELSASFSLFSVSTAHNYSNDPSACLLGLKMPPGTAGEMPLLA